MLRLPQFYKDYEQIPLESVYKAMCNNDNDLSECVVAAIDVLRKNNKFITYEKISKSSPESYKHLESGKILLYVGDHESAINEYNNALMLAPQNSDAMKDAYCFRAHLSFSTKQFSSCIKDVDRCLTMGCPPEMEENLNKMKTGASKFIYFERATHQQKYSTFAEQFFQIKGDNIPNIPGVSSHIKFITESQPPEVVAAKDIPTGTLIALEDAFVSKCSKSQQFVTCYYCNKFSPCLIPCDGCCLALFCDEECKEKSIQEGHKVECKIIELLYLQDIPSIMPVKAVLKMRQMCQSWDELIAASHELGIDRMKNSSLEHIFGSNKFSSLNSYKTQHFIYGEMFKNCMFFANVIHYLDLNTSFLPDSLEDKNDAIRAISRIMMHLSLNATPVQTIPATSVATMGATVMHYCPNYGYFPFISKLNHSCLPNVHVVGMRRGAALVTIMPIKEGTKIAISYLPHWLELTEEENKKRQEKLFVMNKILCKCIICDNNENFKKQLLTKSQQKIFQKWSLDETVKKDRLDVASVYIKTCQTMELLRDAPYSEEFNELFRMFLKCLMIISIYNFPNVIMNMHKICNSVHAIYGKYGMELIILESNRAQD